MPDLFLPLFIFIFGLIVGSFLNCVIYRLEKGQSFLGGRSYCPHCKRQLGFWDLIPVLSFLFLMGRCCYCQKKISLQYPLVEITTGILFFLIFHYAKYDMLYVIYGLIIASLLIIIFVYDLRRYIIPDKVIYSAIVITLFYQLFRVWNFGNWDLFGVWNLGFGILPSLFFLAIIIFSQGRWMGLGDFKLAVFMGLFLGWPYILIALFLSFFIGAIIGIGLIIFSKKTLKSEIPFGPFLVIGTFLVMFFGDWLLSLFLLK